MAPVIGGMMEQGAAAIERSFAAKREELRLQKS
jgi:hypothetical protein